MQEALEIVEDPHNESEHQDEYQSIRILLSLINKYHVVMPDNVPSNFVMHPSHSKYLKFSSVQDLCSTKIIEPKRSAIIKDVFLGVIQETKSKMVEKELKRAFEEVDEKETQKREKKVRITRMNTFSLSLAGFKKILIPKSYTKPTFSRNCPTKKSPYRAYYDTLSSYVNPTIPFREDYHLDPGFLLSIAHVFSPLGPNAAGNIMSYVFGGFKPVFVKNAKSVVVIFHSKATPKQRLNARKKNVPKDMDEIFTFNGEKYPCNSTQILVNGTVWNRNVDLLNKSDSKTYLFVTVPHAGASRIVPTTEVLESVIVGKIHYYRSGEGLNLWIYA